MFHVIEKVNEPEVEKLKQELSKYNVFTKGICKNIKDNVHFEKVLNVFIDLKSEWSSEKNSRSFWLSCLEMSEILLNTIYAGRSGSWHHLLESITEMLPYCFAYDHINYARYLTYFLGDMLQLNQSFPEMYKQVIVGDFATQLSSDKLFSCIETGKAIEMNLNKDTKTPSGTTGFSTNVQVVQR